MLFSLFLALVLGGFCVVAGGTKGLQIAGVKPSAALLDRQDVINNPRELATASAADWLPAKLGCPDPFPALGSVDSILWRSVLVVFTVLLPPGFLPLRLGDSLVQVGMSRWRPRHQVSRFCTLTKTILLVWSAAAVVMKFSSL